MEKIKTIIIDDEAHGRSNLTILIRDHCPQLQVIGEAGSANEATQHIIELKPGLIFLDIHMPEFDGFDLLNRFENRDFAVVFVTAFPNYGIQAIKAGAVDYLLKPIIIAELQAAVARVIEWHSVPPPLQVPVAKDKIMLSHTHGFLLANLQDIVRLEADNNYSKVFFEDGKVLLVSKPLKDFEMRLANSTFVRIHKSDIINIMYVKQYTVEEGGTVIMKDATRLYISRQRMPDFMEVVNKYSISLW